MAQNTFQDKLLTEMKASRFLGLNLSNNLNWEPHLLTGKRPLIPGLRSQLGMISKLRNSLSKKLKLMIVNSLILSRINYGLSIWGNSSPTQLKKVQVILNTAARFITGLPKITRQSTLMVQCNWLNLEELIEYHSTIQMWKVVNWQCPQHMTSKIHVTPDSRIMTSIPRLKMTTNSFRWKTILYWNNLPDDLREEKSLNRFKVCTKRWIRDRRPDPGDNDDHLTQMDT